MVMTKEELARSIENSLREADRLGLVHVGIRLNDAIVALDSIGIHPPGPNAFSESVSSTLPQRAIDLE